MLGDQPLEGRAGQFRVPIEWASRTERSEHARVHQVELRMGGEFPERTPSKDRQRETDQQVLEHGEVARRHLAFDLTFSREIRHVQHGAVAEARRFEKARERADVPHQALRLNFLTHVEGRVGPERGLRLGRVDDERYQAEGEGGIHAEGRAQFGRHEGVHCRQESPAGQQVHAGSLEFPRARPGQDEAEALVPLDELVNDREEPRRSLYLVDDDRSAPGMAGHCVS